MIVREWEQQLMAGGLGLENARQLLACFYADTVLLAMWDTSLYDRVGLMTNTTKTGLWRSSLGGYDKVFWTRRTWRG